MSNSHTLRRFDMNLLVVFDAVYSERSATRAAERLALSQTAISHALARLRGQLNDQLFVRIANGMQPTPFAHELAPKIRDALERMERIVSSSEFDPAQSDRTFRIGVTEYFAAIALPKLVATLQAEAPGIKLITFPNIVTNTRSLLNDQEIDFSIGYLKDSTRDELSPSMKSTVLMKDRYVCVMRRDHPLANGPLTLDRYCAAQHLSFAINGEDFGPIDRVLKRHGGQRDVAMRICHYVAAPEILLSTQLLITMASRMAARYCSDRALVIRPAPFDNGQPLQLAWNERVHTSESHQWMRSKIVEVCRAITRSTDTVDAGELV